MYLSALAVYNFRQFGAAQQGLVIRFNKGVTALVGENDAGKSSVIDALRLVLQTRDGEYVRLQPADFHIPKDGHPSGCGSLLAASARILRHGSVVLTATHR